jgi:hypothetical protein
MIPRQALRQYASNTVGGATCYFRRRTHIYVDMGKSPRVTFKMRRIAEDDWQIVAECPGTETKYIKGLKSKAEVDEWLQGSRRIDWLRSQGYAK